VAYLAVRGLWSGVWFWVRVEGPVHRCMHDGDTRYTHHRYCETVLKINFNYATNLIQCNLVPALINER
jgi:hypothetical protein